MSGYKQIAELIFESCCQIAASVKTHKQLALVCDPEVNVVAFRAASREMGDTAGFWPPTAIYALVGPGLMSRFSL